MPYAHPDVHLVTPQARVNTIMHTASEITVRPEGTWKLDFEGSSRWGLHSYNANPVAFTSGIWVMMTQTLVPTERINDGAYYGTEFRLPRGTWMNPDDRRTAHAYSWHFLVSSWTSLWRGISRGYLARGFLEEVNAGNANTSNWLQGGGVNQWGESHAANSFEASAEGTGATAVRDGLDHAAAIWNPEGDMGDMEIWEIAEPLLYLGRNVKTNSAGYGRYRGGCGFETLRMVWGAKDWTMFFMGNGYMVSDWGLMGGYPSAAGYRFEAHETGLEERIRTGASLPLGGDADPDALGYEQHLAAGARVSRDQQACTTESSFADYDLYLNYLRGGPGFGDPLERDPKAVERDLNGNYLLPRFAESVYGAVFAKDAQGRYVVDEAGTTARRAEIRKERIARAVPVRDWMKAERERILAKDASIQVRHMFASCFASSEPFRREFRSFWDLPESWTLDEREIVAEDPSYGYGSLAREPLEALPDVTRIVLTEE